jgi:hypothetical protein
LYTIVVETITPSTVNIYCFLSKMILYCITQYTQTHKTQTHMKKITFLFLFMAVLGTTQLSAHNPSKPVKTTPAKRADFSVTLSRGSNVSGTWVISFSGSAGTYQFQFTSSSNTVTIPSGTYQVGIYPAGGGSSSYSIAGAVCTYNYSNYGTSAAFSNVPCTCGSGSFSIN